MTARVVTHPAPRAAVRPAVGGHLTLAFAIAVMVLPLVWMVLASFKGMGEIIYRLPITWLPGSLAPTNYGTATQTVPFGRFFVNSPVGLTLLMNSDGVTNWGVPMAGTALVTVPVLAVFFLLQRRIVAGLVAGAGTG